MFIRSQDGKALTNVNLVTDIVADNMVNGQYAIKAYYLTTNSDSMTLSLYSNEEKALKVLDMIEKEYLKYATIENDCYGVQGIFNMPKVFHMPADEDVEV